MAEERGAKAALPDGVTLYLIRHGETEWNRQSRYQGQRDIPLNDTGRLQSERNGRLLLERGIHPDAFDFVCSPLGRAVETMRIMLTALGADTTAFRITPEIRELNYGHWEGQLASALSDIDPISVAEKAKDPHGWRPRGGESYRDLQARIARWLETIERDTVAVTHGGVSRVARGALLDVSDTEVPFLPVPQDRILMIKDRQMDWL